MFDIKEFISVRKEMLDGKLSFFNSYLDDFCGGILRNDLVVLAAPSGFGKSQLAATIAYQNATNGGTKVYFFAMEAFKYEIEYRISYTHALLNYYRTGNQYIKFSFFDYITDKIPEQIKPFIEDSQNSLRVMAESLVVKYPERAYGVSDFEKDLVKVSADADLIIIDHLHYFDIEGRNENLEITNILKRLRHMVLVSDIPILLVSHIRKNNTVKAKIISGQEDLHGTSNIAKIATKIITIAPDYSRETGDNTKYATLIRVAKNRYNGAATRYCASMDYDIKTNTYSDAYYLHKLSFDETELLEVTSKPDWARKGKIL